jgi:hypothetical protein
VDQNIGDGIERENPSGSATRVTPRSDARCSACRFGIGGGSAPCATCGWNGERFVFDLDAIMKRAHAATETFGPPAGDAPYYEYTPEMRAKIAPDGPWHVAAAVIRASDANIVALTGPADDPQSVADAGFYGHARRDVLHLSAEVARLRALITPARVRAIENALRYAYGSDGFWLHGDTEREVLGVVADMRRELSARDEVTASNGTSRMASRATKPSAR